MAILEDMAVVWLTAALLLLQFSFQMMAMCVRHDGETTLMIKLY